MWTWHTRIHIPILIVTLPILTCQFSWVLEMDWSHFFPDGGLVQYPDAKIYNAATMLNPEERPKIPIQMVHNDWRKSRPASMWFDSAKPDFIGVSADSPIYKANDRPRLAAALAHEAIHSGGELNEPPAYDKEAEVLRRFGLGSSKRIKDIAEIKKRFQ
jgi:hypothetical protein